MLMATWRWRTIRLMCAHLQRKWNQPSRADYYVMQLSAQVANMLRKKGARRATVDQMKLKWLFAGDKSSNEAADALGKARWLGALAAVGPGLVDEYGNRMGAAEIRESAGLRIHDPEAESEDEQTMWAEEAVA